MHNYCSVVEEYKILFSSIPRRTEAIQHYIPTGSARPIWVPPRRIPAQFRDEVQRQILEMLRQGIIQESSSPWLVACIYVPKKNGEIRICIDYRELNKRTEKNAYPLPLPDEVQDCLERAQIFSKLDCHKGFWQVPIAAEDCQKTASHKDLELVYKNFTSCLLASQGHQVLFSTSWIKFSEN